MFVYYNNFIEKFLWPNQSYYRNRKWEVTDIETFNVRHFVTMLILHPKMDGRTLFCLGSLASMITDWIWLHSFEQHADAKYLLSMFCYSLALSDNPHQ